MAGMIMRHLAWAAALTAALAGCEEGASPFAKKDAPDGSPITGDAVTTETLDGAAAEGSDAGTAATEAVATEAAAIVPRSGRTGPQDVEAPSVFQTTDTALWDGRPSLGGIWVAAPNVKDPERVIMRNAANGRSVEGALFRRERENPGPPLQISSDAAEALGLLAGQPAQITVTAIRRQEAPAEPPRRTAAANRKATAATPAAEPAPAASAATAETTAAAAAPATVAEAAEAAEATATGTTGAEAATAAEANAEAATEPQLSPREQRAAERKAAREARLAARAAARAEREAARAARNAARGAAGAGGAAAGAPLSAIDPIAGAAAAIDRADGAAAAEAPSTEAPAAPAAAAGSNVVQVATFSDEANASRTVATLTKAGLAAEIRKSTNAGETVYAVIVRGDGTRAAFLAKVRGLGFKDAYVLSE